MPAMAIESGPAAGVIAAALAGKELGLPNLISFDMGGTTAKASLIADGEVAVTAEYEVGGSGHLKRWLHGTGHPVRVPVIDLAEVSAGGGSIAWIDPGGALKVGPRSAGATPGPAAYGLGGSEPTVTDADVVLGYLDREALLGGALAINLAAAQAAIRERVAEPLGLGVTEAGAAIVEIVNSNMAEALRIVSVERGHDAREFALIAFGGAGPVHAAALAAELQIAEVIVPPASGAFSALGVVASDLKRDYSRTLYADLRTLDPTRVAEALAEMEAVTSEWLASAEIPPERCQLLRAADLRYRRQAYELTVPMAQGAVTRESLDRLARAFHDRHRQTYGHANPEEEVQLVNLRLTAIGRLPGLTLAQPPAAAPARRRKREVWFPEDGSAACPIHWRDGLAAGETLTGPAIIEAMDSTIVVPPGWIASVDGKGYIRLRRRRAHARHPSRRADPPDKDRSGTLRGGQERALFDRRGNEDRPR
jgi:N-methylhydantoinase A